MLKYNKPGDLAKPEILVSLAPVLLELFSESKI